MKKFTCLVVSYLLLLSALLPNTVFANENNLSANTQNYTIESNGLITDSTLEKKSDDADIVEVPDVALREKILAVLRGGIPTPDENKAAVFTKRDLRRIAHIYTEQCLAGKVADLTGLEYADNLEILSINFQNCNDLSPIANCKKLKVLKAKDVQGKDKKPITNLEPLSKLTNLEDLDLFYARPVSIEPLNNLINMKKIVLDSTRITNIDFAANMPKLIEFRAEHNEIVSLEPLKNAVNLTFLNLNYAQGSTSNNRITDITPLAKMQKLNELHLSNHNIHDIDTISDLKSLSFVELSNNKIEKFEPLLYLPSLSTLWAGNNPGYNGNDNSQTAYTKAKEIFNQINTTSFVKEDKKIIDNLLEDQPTSVKSFFSKTTLDKLAEISKQLETKDNIKNDIFKTRPKEYIITKILETIDIKIKENETIKDKLPTRIKAIVQELIEPAKCSLLTSHNNQTIILPIYDKNGNLITKEISFIFNGKKIKSREGYIKINTQNILWQYMDTLLEYNNNTVLIITKGTPSKFANLTINGMVIPLNTPEVTQELIAPLKIVLSDVELSANEIIKPETKEVELDITWDLSKFDGKIGAHILSGIIDEDTYDNPKNLVAKQNIIIEKSNMETNTNSSENNNSSGNNNNSSENNNNSSENNYNNKIPLAIIKNTANMIWTKGSTVPTIIANGDANKLKEVLFDGKIVNKKNYEIVSGSTELTFHKDWLSKQKVGTHTITLVYNNNETISTKLIIKDKIKNINTSDNSNLSILFTMLLISIITLLTIFKNKKYNA